LVLGVIATLSGLAIWEPTQLSWLTTSFGGYDFARVVHFLSLVALAAFTVAHVVLVLLHPRTIVDMTVGGPRDAAVDQ
jgi:thiosulfate reductase cytochrome b subunit